MEDQAVERIGECLCFLGSADEGKQVHNFIKIMKISINNN